MKTIRYGFWALVAIILIVVGLANRGEVTLHAMPDVIGDLIGVSPNVTLPLYAVIFLGVGAGLLIGFFWEWIREGRVRADARAKGREVVRLEREIGRLRAKKAEGQDEVMSLLESAESSR